MATMDDIAARAGVSRGAVSLALRRSPKISAKTTEHIFKVAHEMGYRPNLNASRLAARDFSTFGLLVSDLHNPIMADILDGFVMTDGDEVPDTYLGSGFNSPFKERALIESFLSHRVKGVVLLGSLLPDAEIQTLARQIPTVAVGRKIDGVDCVLVDDLVGGRLAAEHIKTHGHLRIAHIDGGDGAGAGPRKQAFITALEEGVDLTVLRGDYTEEGGYRCACILFAKPTPPTAIFAANDLSALGVLGAAREFGLVAGKDFDLVGFDDIKLASYDYISLTTVSYSRADMGKLARDLVQRRCSDADAPAKTIELPPRLIVRNTSRSLANSGPPLP
ncbi:LacI family transcriptional regulator [Rhizobium anhuiense]|uniref:LacI family DNA-binding transcriptional regulator n=1 Tax=Rhizobium anhuiense TaxID=1184720 RepID=UPI000BE85F24|nr:LacI family DNA-binding transcriptional regulator [Rhizobium anhuiense]PDS63054.1 LacI family transcriptional regulator [Rhizobium anhuiense]